MENFITMEKRCWSFYLVFAVIYREALCRMPCTELLRVVDPHPRAPGIMTLRVWQCLLSIQQRVPSNNDEGKWLPSKRSVVYWRQTTTPVLCCWRLIIATNNLLPGDQVRVKLHRAGRTSNVTEDWAHSLLMAVSPSLYCWDSSVVLLPLPFR